MATFKDGTGHEWTVPRLTSGHARDLKEQCGVDLRDALKADARENSLAAALDDYGAFGRLVWFLIGDQAEKAGVGPRDLAYRFDGETLDRFVMALSEEILRFTQPRTADQAAAAFRAKSEQVTAAMGRAWDAVAKSPISGNGAARSAAGSESPPPVTASAN